VYIKAKNTNLHTNFPELGTEKHFQDLEMRVIDFPHKITPETMIFRRKIQNFHIFASIHKLISLNQGQESIFMRAIDFPHKIISIWIIFRIFEKNFPRENMKKSPNSGFFRYTHFSFRQIFIGYD
jgi:hypothetical protein